MWKISSRGISTNTLRFQSRVAFKPPSASASASPATQKPQQYPQQQPQQEPQQQPEDATLFSDDWSKSFSGLSTQRVEPEVEKLLTQPVDQLDVEVKPDGLIYLPEIKYRRILNKAFGPGGWGLAPRTSVQVDSKIVSREYALVCGGRLFSIARGEQEYFDPTGISTATEAAKSNALMRCCKDLGIASELCSQRNPQTRDPRFIREFKAKHAIEVWGEDRSGKKKKLWRRKDSPKLTYPYKEACINEWLTKDAEQIPELDDLINSSASTSYTLPPSPSWNAFVKRKTIHLPDSLFEQYNRLQCRCFMGLFPDIDRAWITIDNKLYLWDYVDGIDFASYEDLPELIVTVGLVKPKPGVFVETIKHLLVICTSSTVSLLGLSAAPSPSRELALYSTGISVNTDGVDMVSITSTQDGRIFLSGSDSCLYELNYQAEEGWFKSRCSLSNHSASPIANFVPTFLKQSSTDPIIGLAIDDARNCLYTLSSNSVIELYHLGKDGHATQKVASASEIARQAAMLCPGFPQILDQRTFSIKRIFVISPAESSSVHLMAVTSTGVRLYFTHHRRSYGFYMTPSPSAAPTGLELLHVRPPPQSTQPNQNTIKNLISSDSIYYGHGLYIAASANSEEFDSLLCTGQDVGTAGLTIPQQQPVAPTVTTTTTANVRPSLVEGASNLILEGRTWAIGEESSMLANANKLPQSMRKGLQGKEQVAMSELTVQTAYLPRRFLVLTNMGLSVIAKQRPVDVLRNILESSSTSSRDQEIVSFFNNFGKDQSCAMALAIAAGNPIALSMGEDLYPAGSNIATEPAPPATLSADITQSARRLFYDFGGRPVSIDRGYPAAATSMNLDALSTNTEILFSGRHNGLVLYLSRLLRPIWKEKVTKLSPTNFNLRRQISNISDTLLSNAQRNIADLQVFLKSNQQLFATTAGDSRDRTDQSAWKAEHASLIGIDHLITQCIEGISFILLLIDYNLSETLSHCEQNLQEQFLNLTYVDLLTTNHGRDIARNVVNEVINQQISKQISIDAISEILQQRCGSFCSADDVLLYKAIENVRKAHETRDKAERGTILRESLRLFGKAARNLSIEKLKEVITEYRLLEFASGAIDLSLICAREWDAAELGLQFWNEGRSVYFQPNSKLEVPIEVHNDTRVHAYKRRQSCYECIFETLAEAKDKVEQAVSKHERVEEVEQYRRNAFRRAIESYDAVFHSCFYDWLVSQGLTDLLLDIQSPYLEQHLMRDPLTLEKCELLWQFYVRRSRFYDAARVLASLADSVEFPLSLSRRLEYLSLALSNAKSQRHPASASDIGDVEFMTNLEEKIEVAQVQVEIYRAVKEHTEVAPDAKQNMQQMLEQRLYNVSELFREFAEPLALLEVQLLIFHIADFYDPSLIAQTWEVLVEHTHYLNVELQPDERFDAVAGVVYSLARRFYPSKISFPLDTVINILEQYSYEHGVKKAGWVPTTLNDAGVPYAAIYEVMDTMLESQIPPWQTQNAIVFLVADVVVMVEAWLRSHTLNFATGQGALPIRRVDESVSEYLALLSSAPYANISAPIDVKEIREQLSQLQLYLRSKF
ncbi:hypothetical protein E3P92_02688 [Wallemia ichthyophaga]|uniref:Uncharacterized protein n=1 Tax=Wallemia ichthyophaga TaxID=245174 RepID=A0A4T0H5J0_WALIC|nr:hypothetical protein E3P90_02931 [Wallemia ichthyophaga]TIB10479.1 hypothetical protein E3P93_02888 [Wallemia ichthyophaga]TIB12125.1 hypothetical protein E3P92_02688 [Wallemia ichthyophaga]TIB21059.1 hypothetical protein E3P89_02864 [Wallemia ichthyophaga]TIB22748.1 hypothetical protein E3P88_02860 [Wallemia ichthyophaga]